MSDRLCFNCSHYTTCPAANYKACPRWRDWKAPLVPLKRDLDQDAAIDAHMARVKTRKEDHE